MEQQLQEQDTQPLEGEAPRFNPRRLVGAVPVLPPITSQIKQDIEAPEGEAPRFNPRRLIGAVPVLPPITDQIKLLKPGTYPLQETIGGRPTSASPSPSPCPSPQPVEDKALPWLDAKLQSANIESQTQNWYQTDPKVPPDVVSASRETEGEKGHEQHAGGFGVSVPLRRRSSLDAGTEVQIPKALESVPPPLPPLPLQQQPPTLPQQPKKKLMIPSGQPPWIEMVDKEVTGGCCRGNEETSWQNCSRNSLTLNYVAYCDTYIGKWVRGKLCNNSAFHTSFVFELTIAERSRVDSHHFPVKGISVFNL